MHSETPTESSRLLVRGSPLTSTGRSATRWALTITTALLTGLVAIVIVMATDSIQHFRSHLMDDLWHRNPSSPLGFWTFGLVNLSLAVASAGLCLFWAPDAVGSGIPQVKAYLNGVRVQRFTTKRLFVVKILATILSVSSGLAIGPEGPLVHIGAILGASCTKLSNMLLQYLPLTSARNVWTFLTTDLAHFSNDAERRDLVSIGAGAGFAAAFGAPIGGVLFTVEEAATFFQTSMMLRTLVATSLATFCLAVLRGDLSEYSIISLGDIRSSDFDIFMARVVEVPLYVLVGAAGGALGGCFCRMWKSLQLLRERIFPSTRSYLLAQALEVALVSIVTSTAMYTLPLVASACQPTSTAERGAFVGYQFNCPDGQINELASIFFGSREEAIKQILTEPEQFHVHTLLVVGWSFFFLMTMTLGVSLPSGIFLPTVLIGSCLGGAMGIFFERHLSADVSPSTFALVGAAALLAGVQRSTVSLCVILVEGTGQVKVLIPVIITVIVARYVGDRISSHGLYEIAMEVLHYPYLDHWEHKRYDIIAVREVMSTPVVTVAPIERVDRIVELLEQCEHNGFPVVDPETGAYMGLVRRDQLVALIECGAFVEEPLKNTPLRQLLAYHIKDDRYDRWDQTSTRQLLAGDEYDAHAWLVSVRQTRDRFLGDSVLLEEEASIRHESTTLQEMTGNETLPRAVPSHMATVTSNDQGNVSIGWLHPDAEDRSVHVAAVMNRGAYAVAEGCPLSKAHYLFTSLGLRHLVVLGVSEGRSTVVGMVTRVNLVPEAIEESTGYAL